MLNKLIKFSSNVILLPTVPFINSPKCCACNGLLPKPTYQTRKVHKSSFFGSNELKNECKMFYIILIKIEKTNIQGKEWGGTLNSNSSKTVKLKEKAKWWGGLTYHIDSKWTLYFSYCLRYIELAKLHKIIRS